jgi:hypothetical protein
MKHLNLTIPKPCASSNIRAGFALLKASLACIILLLLSAESFSQTASVKGKIEMFERHESYMHTANSHIVRGIIKDEVGNPMPGVNIYLKGTAEGTVTDVAGSFEFPRRLEPGEILTISYIGYESIEYVVQNTEADVEIVMNVDVRIIGEVAVEKVYTSKPTFSQWLKNLF